MLPMHINWGDQPAFKAWSLLYIFRTNSISIIITHVLWKNYFLMIIYIYRMVLVDCKEHFVLELYIYNFDIFYEYKY